MKPRKRTPARTATAAPPPRAAPAAQSPRAAPPASRSPHESSASLRLADGPLVGPVLCRVVSMLLARANCPVDRMDDALVVCDALTVHAPSHASDGHLALAVSVQARSSSCVSASSPSTPCGACVQDAVLPGVGNVLERMTDVLRVEPSADGAGEELVLGLTF